jgi:hypothetical protein
VSLEVHRPRTHGCWICPQHVLHLLSRSISNLRTSNRKVTKCVTGREKPEERQAGGHSPDVPDSRGKPCEPGWLLPVS